MFLDYAEIVNASLLLNYGKVLELEMQKATFLKQISF